MFRTIQSESKLDGFQQCWADDVGRDYKPGGIKSTQAFLFFLCGIIAPIGMMYRAIVNPELVEPIVVNVVFFASLVYIGLLFVQAFGLGVILLFSGGFAFKVNEEKTVGSLDEYKLLKSMVRPYTSVGKVFRTRLQQLLSIVFLVACVMIGGWWTFAAVIVFLLIGWNFFCQRASRNAVVNSLQHLTREVAEDFDAGLENPSQSLIIESAVVDVESKPVDDTRSEVTFLYEAMDATGMEIKAEITASSESAAQEKIRQQGYFVTKIKRKETT